jgi:hypothetical protein
MRFPRPDRPNKPVPTEPAPSSPPAAPPMPVIGEFTPNIKLFKPDQTSGYNVDHFNYNFEVLDDAIEALDKEVGEISAGGGTALKIKRSEWIDVVDDGDAKKIVYKDTWKPTELPVK